MTMRTKSTGASSARPSTVTPEDKNCNIKELAKLLLQEQNSAIELKLMHAIAKKHQYQLQPGNVAKLQVAKRRLLLRCLGMWGVVCY
jgi:hypothetical protein